MDNTAAAALSARQQWERDRQIVLAQLHNLTLALRSNAKFSSKTRFVQAGRDPQHWLTLLVVKLRESLFSPLSQNASVSEHELLAPFCEVALSEETTEPITGVALAAFVTFLDLKCSFLTEESLVRLSNCASNSRSEIADAQSHEAVLARILQVYVGCARHPAAAYLSEEHTVGMIQRAFVISSHGEPSELLRRTAEQAMNDIVTAVFYRVVTEGYASKSKDGQGVTTGALLVRYICRLIMCDVDVPPAGRDSLHAVSIAAVQLQGLCLAHTALFILKDELREVRCAELLRCVRYDLCRALLTVGGRSDNIIVLSQLLRTAHLVVQFASVDVIPQTLTLIDTIHLTPMRLAIGLGPSSTSLSPTTPVSTVASPKISFPSSVPDELEAREAHEMLLESLLEFCSDQAFPSFCFVHYDLSTHYPPLLENLCQFLSTSCIRIGASDRFNGAVGTPPVVSPAAAAATPSTPAVTASGASAGIAATGGGEQQHLNQINILSLESLMAMLHAIGERVASATSSSVAAELSCVDEMVEDMQYRRNRLLTFSKLFSRDPVKEGLKYIRTPPPGKTHDCFGVSADCSGWEIGEFLFRYKSVFDKTVLGDYLGDLGKEPVKPDPADDPDGSRLAEWELQRQDDYKIAGTVRFFELQLKGFLNCFSFQGKGLLRSIREMVFQMRLPGESQKIDRVMQAFATHWYSLNKESGPHINPFRTEDAAFILSFSIIMLNTDLHSGKMDKTMTKDQFRSMNRGIDGGHNIPDEYLNLTYDDVKESQIVMIDMLKQGFNNESAWLVELTECEHDVEPAAMRICLRGSTSAQLAPFDRHVFKMLWRHCVAAFITVVEVCGSNFTIQRPGATIEEICELQKAKAPRDYAVFQLALTGLATVADVSSKLNCHDALDNVVIRLIRQTNIPAKDAYGPLIEVGRSVRQLVALQQVFRLVVLNGQQMLESWGEFASLVMRCFLAGIFAADFGDSSEGGDSSSSATPQRRPAVTDVSDVLLRNPGIVPTPAARNQATAESGWLSGLWGSTAAAEQKRLEKISSEVASLRRLKTIVPPIEEIVRLDFASRSAFVLWVQALCAAAAPLTNAPSEGLAASHAIHLVLEVVSKKLDLFDDVSGVVYEYIHSLVRNVMTILTQPIDAGPPSGAPATSSKKSTSAAEEGTTAANKPLSRQSHEYWKNIAARIVDAVLRFVVALSKRPALSGSVAALVGLLTTAPQVILRDVVSQPLSATLYRIVVGSSTAFRCPDADAWNGLIYAIHRAGVVPPYVEVRTRYLAVLIMLAKDGQYCVLENSQRLAVAMAGIVLAPPVTATETQDDTSWTSISQFDMNPVADVRTPNIISVEHRLEERVPEALVEVHKRLLTLIPKPTAGLPVALPAGWTNAWLTTLGGLWALVAASRLQRVSSDSLLCLQRCILDHHLAELPTAEIYELFSTIVFPLVEKLCMAGGAQTSSAALMNPLAAAAATAASLPAVTLSFLSPSVLISTVFGPLAGPDRIDTTQDNNKGSPSSPAHPLTPIAIDASLNSAHHNSEEMQCRAVSILPKAFLQYSPKLATAPNGLSELWKKLIGTLYALYTHSTHSHHRSLSVSHEAGMLREAIQENVKNLVFVLTATIASPEHRQMLKHYPQFWQLTSELLQPFDFSPLLVAHLTANKLLP
jgi:hypothetical protein